MLAMEKAKMGATGYTPQEAALEITQAGFPITAKQVRRAIRKGNIKASQFSGRWYIPRTTLQAIIKAKGKKEKEATPAG